MGTGGIGLQPFKATVAGSAVKQHNTLGVLALTLQPAGYQWSFRPVGNGFHDSGNGVCH